MIRLTRLTRKLNKGFQTNWLRNRHLVGEDLTDSEYRLWDLLCCLVISDKKYKEEFGLITASDEELATLLKKKATSIWRAKKGLIRKGFLHEIEKQTYRPLFPSEIEINIENLFADIKEKSPKNEQSIANLQEERDKTNKPLIFSPSTSFITSKTGRTDGEYQRIINEAGYVTMDLSDLRWIDENVKASKNITVKSIRQTVSEVVAFAQAAAKNLLTPKALAFA